MKHLVEVTEVSWPGGGWWSTKAWQLAHWWQKQRNQSEAHQVDQNYLAKWWSDDQRFMEWLITDNENQVCRLIFGYTCLISHRHLGRSSPQGTPVAVWWIDCLRQEVLCQKCLCVRMFCSMEVSKDDLKTSCPSGSPSVYECPIHWPQWDSAFSGDTWRRCRVVHLGVKKPPTESAECPMHSITITYLLAVIATDFLDFNRPSDMHQPVSVIIIDMLTHCSLFLLPTLYQTEKKCNLLQNYPNIWLPQPLLLVSRPKLWLWTNDTGELLIIFEKVSMICIDLLRVELPP